MFLAVGRQLWRTSPGPLKLVGNRSVGDGEPKPVLDGVKRRFFGGVYRGASGLEFKYGLGRRRVLR